MWMVRHEFSQIMCVLETHKHSSHFISKGFDLIKPGLSLQFSEVDQTAINKLMAKPEFADKLEAHIIRLDKESAAVLFLSNHMHHRQWNERAKALNAELLEREKYTGGVIPVTDTIVKWCASGKYTCCSDFLCRLHCRAVLNGYIHG
jgi:hypothetical protein